MTVTAYPISPSTVESDCEVSDEVGDCVYVRAASVSGRMQVAKADPRDLSKMPVVGVIERRGVGTRATVRLMGVATLESDISAPSRVWVGLDGKFANSISGLTALPGERVVIQEVGTVIDDDRVLIHPRAPMVRIG